MLNFCSIPLIPPRQWKVHSRCGILNVVARVQRCSARFAIVRRLASVADVMHIFLHYLGIYLFKSCGSPTQPALMYALLELHFFRCCTFRCSIRIWLIRAVFVVIPLLRVQVLAVCLVCTRRGLRRRHGSGGADQIVSPAPLGWGEVAAKWRPHMSCTRTFGGVKSKTPPSSCTLFFPWIDAAGYFQ